MRGLREHTIGRQRLAFAGWFAHAEFVAQNVHGAFGRRDDRF